MGLFSKCNLIMISFIGRISCRAFRTCSEKVDFPVQVAKSFLCSLNLALKLILSYIHLRICPILSGIPRYKEQSTKKENESL